MGLAVLGARPGTPWRIDVEVDGTPHVVTLDPGDVRETIRRSALLATGEDPTGEEARSALKDDPSFAEAVRARLGGPSGPARPYPSLSVEPSGRERASPARDDR